MENTIINDSNSGINPNKVFSVDIDGNGTFSTPQHILSNAYSYSIHATDMDGDGNMYILAADSGQFAGEIIWFINLDVLSELASCLIKARRI